MSAEQQPAASSASPSGPLGGAARADAVRRYDGFKLGVTAALVAALWWFWFDGRAPADRPAASSASSGVTPLAMDRVRASQLDLTFAAGRLVMSGVVPDDATHQRWSEAAHQAFGADHVEDRLHVDAAAQQPTIADIHALLAALKPLASGRLLFDGANYQLTGYARSVDAREAAGQGVQTALAAKTAFDNALVVSESEPPKFDDGLLRTHIEFALGSAALTADGQQRLDHVAPAIIVAGKVVEVSGHTDDLGSAVTNQQLSEARAQAVRAALILRGVPEDRLVAKGYGATLPVADNTTAEGRQRNRRIEFVIRP